MIILALLITAITIKDNRKRRKKIEWYKEAPRWAFNWRFKGID
jgi:hypothetical protein